ncbi:hypothetical protein ACMYYO_01785 [Dermacoccaceae bacterium W4C1]
MWSLRIGQPKVYSAFNRTCIAGALSCGVLVALAGILESVPMSEMSAVYVPAAYAVWPLSRALFTGAYRDAQGRLVVVGYHWTNIYPAQAWAEVKEISSNSVPAFSVFVASRDMEKPQRVYPLQRLDFTLNGTTPKMAKAWVAALNAPPTGGK